MMKDYNAQQKVTATISIVRDRFQHIQPSKYDRIEQQETAAPGSGKKAARTNHNIKTE